MPKSRNRRRREKNTSRSSSNQPPQSWWAKLSLVKKVLTGIFAVGAAVFGFWKGYQGLEPSISVMVNSHPPNPFNSDFVFKNDGVLTLQDAFVFMRGRITLADGNTLTVLGKIETQYSRLGNIKPGKTATTRFDIITDRSWRSAHVCLHMSFRYPYPLSSIFPQEDQFGFFHDKDKGINEWIQGSCDIDPGKEDEGKRAT